MKKRNFLFSPTLRHVLDRKMDDGVPHASLFLCVDGGGNEKSNFFLCLDGRENKKINLLCCDTKIKSSEFTFFLPPPGARETLVQEEG